MSLGCLHFCNSSEDVPVEISSVLLNVPDIVVTPPTPTGTLNSRSAGQQADSNTEEKICC
uniref:Uncharacterized protein n=1 Tax=Leptobrachium leishanense TaxID=445787 RepID=A0A8C5Q6E6_9ANUR